MMMTPKHIAQLSAQSKISFNTTFRFLLAIYDQIIEIMKENTISVVGDIFLWTDPTRCMLHYSFITKTDRNHYGQHHAWFSPLS